MELNYILKEMLATLDEAKANNSIKLHLGQDNSIAEIMLIASAGSKRHVLAICDRLFCKAKELSLQPPPMEGLEEGWWVVLDLGGIIVHVFQEEARAFYNLEKLWASLPADRKIKEDKCNLH